MSIIVVVASSNPTKLKATLTGFKAYFSQDIKILPVKAESGVSHQPMGDEETLTGAMNRCQNAFNNFSDADFWVGIEGGVEKKKNEYEAFAWIVIKTKDKISRGKTGTFVLPAKVGKLIDEGKELGEADDIVFGIKDSKKSIGAVGILTKRKTTRAQYYAQAVKLALIPFINNNLYE